MILDFKNKIYVMGILNITPDSFSDGGKYIDPDKALYRCKEMINEGVDIIDIGAISTKPGFDITKIISIQEELDRVIPVIKNINNHFNVLLSLDTFRSEVALEGLKNGINIINDQYGLSYDNNIAKIISENKCYCVLMHNCNCDGCEDIMEKIKNDLKNTLLLAKNNNIDEDKIIIDPGIGFGKSVKQNMEIVKFSNKLKDLGFPILLGCSRKSFIGKTLNREVYDRLYGTLATTAVGIFNGVSIFRVHDVKANVDFINMLKSIQNVS